MRNKNYKILSIILTVLIFTASLFSQGSISVESKVDRNTILIGDVFQYSVIVTHDPDVKLIMPELAANLGMFEIRDYKNIEPQKTDGKIVAQTNYFLSTFDTGEFKIPELQIGYSTVTDTTIKFIKTEPLKISVQSLNPEDAGDIRDIKIPLVPPWDYTQYIKLVLIIILIIAVAFLLIYYIKRRKAGKALLPTRQKPPRPAHEVALEALETLVQSDLLVSGEIKEYYIQISDIIREYIENRFFIYAPEMTTTQLLEKMEQEKLEKLYIDMTREFLDSCDLVKFAKYIPEEKETDIITGLAFDFVNQSKLVIAEPEEPETAASIQDDEPKTLAEEAEQNLVTEEKIEKGEDG
ncbi:hypothetical protein JXQ31_09845 [candidate division KSB1 bacterium]|nr:hypothetical protein [candidate division KSB1 bacterium]